MRDGAQIEGVVTDAQWHETMLDKARPVGTPTDMRIEVKVEFDDGTKSEITCDVKGGSYHGTFLIGQRVPLRYEPDDRSNIQVDLDALKASDHAHAVEAKAAAQEFFKDPPGDRLTELERRRDAGEITPEQFQAESDKIFDEL